MQRPSLSSIALLRRGIRGLLCWGLAVAAAGPVQAQHHPAHRTQAGPTPLQSDGGAVPLRALGYIGLLAYGSHHRRHHGHMVRGHDPHRHGGS